MIQHLWSFALLEKLIMDMSFLHFKYGEHLKEFASLCENNFISCLNEHLCF